MTVSDVPAPLVPWRGTRSLPTTTTTLALLILAALLALVGLSWQPIPFDEGIIATGAMRVAAGAMPHRDFYFCYGPAQLYLLAACYKLLGATFLTERLLDAVIRGGIAVLLFTLLRRHVPAVAALAITLIAHVWVIALRYPGYPIHPSLLMTFLAIVILEPALIRPDLMATPRRLIAAGVAVGGVVLFRYDAGFYVAAITTPVLFWSTGRSGRIRAVAWFCAGIAIPTVPCAALYAAFGVLPGFYHDIFVYPSLYYAPMRAKPFPSLVPLDRQALSVYLPFVLWVTAVWTLIRDRARGGHAPAHRTVVLLLGLSALFYLKGIVRISEEHAGMSIVTAIAALPILAWRRPRSLRSDPVLIAAAAATLALGVGHVFDVHWQIRNNLASAEHDPGWNGTLAHDPSGGSCQPPAELARAQCARLPAAEVDALLYVDRHTTPEETIFVGCGRHDKLYVNNIMFYFLARRTPATRWYHFDPGLQNRADTQRTMIADLTARQTRMVVLDRTWDMISEPNGSARSSGVTLLDDFIAARYHRVAEFGPYLILETNGT